MIHQTIEQSDLIERYVRDQLAPDERTAFEEHFFACEECFQQVQATERFIAGVRDAAATGRLNPVTGRALTPVTPWTNWFKPAFAIAATATALILVVGIGWLLLRGRNSPQQTARDQHLQQPVHPNQEPPQNASPMRQASPASSETDLARASQATPGKIAKPNSGRQGIGNQSPSGKQATSPETGASEADETRSATGRTKGASLSEVKRIYIESSVNDDVSRNVRTGLQDQIKNSKRFALAELKEQADAVLKVSATQVTSAQAGASQVSISVRMVNASGQVIWKGRRPYVGRISDQTSLILTNLIDEARRQKRK